MPDVRIVQYDEFKVVEHNLRECFDLLRATLHDIRELRQIVDRMNQNYADLSRRVARLEDRQQFNVKPEHGGI
jgi:type III secretory pathway component EscV